jgi:hypothetical protein
MGKIFIKKRKINEDDTNAANTQQNTTPQNQQTDNAQQTDTGQQQTTSDAVKKSAEVIALQKQLDALKMTYTEAKKNLEKNYITKRSAMIAQAAAKGIDTSQLVVGESVKESSNPALFSMGDLRFSKKLFESKKGESLVKEWQKLLYSAIEGANTSRTTTMEELWTPARIIKNKIYEWETKDWSSEIVPKNHWTEVSEFIKDYITRSRDLSYGKNELDRIIEKLEERVRGSKSFSWIFGRDIDKK